MTPPATVSLREISAGNRAAVEALAVAAAQTIFVDGVTESIAEAAQVPEARPWYRAIYAGDQPVGFVMIADGVPSDVPYLVGPYFLWRLLIDEHHQRRGYGTAALRLVVEHVRTRPDSRVLLTSVHPGEGSPLGFYLGLGFRETGAEHNGEQVLELDLTTSGPRGRAADGTATRSALASRTARVRRSDMANQITCTARSNPPAPAHGHILSVGLIDGRQQSVETVRFRMSQGDTYYTYGAGKSATVRAYDCYCGAKTITSGMDAVVGNNLNSLPAC